MTIRLFGALLCGAALLTIVPPSSVSAQGVTIEGPGVGVRVGRERGRTGSQDGTTRATTVKSSKSNTSDRMGGGGFHISDNGSPLPQDRKTNKAGSRTGKPAIFDRWGRTGGGGAQRTNGSVGDPHETTGDGRRKSSTSDRMQRRGDGFAARPTRSN